MAEMMAVGADTPGPDYQVPEVDTFKKRAKSIKFDQVKTARLDPIKRSEQTDFFETNKAVAACLPAAPKVGFSRSPKKSFAEAAAVKNKVPGVGNYKISDRAYKMLSPSPSARRR